MFQIGLLSVLLPLFIGALFVPFDDVVPGFAVSGSVDKMS